MMMLLAISLVYLLSEKTWMPAAFLGRHGVDGARLESVFEMPVDFRFRLK